MSKFQNIFVHITKYCKYCKYCKILKCICLNVETNLFKFCNVFVKTSISGARLPLSSPPSGELSVGSKLPAVDDNLVKNENYICPNLPMYLSKLKIVFVLSAVSNSILLPKTLSWFQPSRL